MQRACSLASSFLRWLGVIICPPQQLFTWRHDAKKGRLALPEEAMSFVPVVAAADDENSSPASSTPAKGRIEVHLGAAVVQEQLKLDPFGGANFVFRAKRADRVKVLVWDG